MTMICIWLMIDHEQSSGAGKAMLLFLHKQNVDIILSEIHKDSDFLVAFFTEIQG